MLYCMKLAFFFLSWISFTNIHSGTNRYIGGYLINRNINYQSVLGIDFNAFINSRNISTIGISSAGVTTTDESRLKRYFFFGNCF